MMMMVTIYFLDPEIINWLNLSPTCYFMTTAHFTQLYFSSLTSMSYSMMNLHMIHTRCLRFFGYSQYKFHICCNSEKDVTINSCVDKIRFFK